MDAVIDIGSNSVRLLLPSLGKKIAQKEIISTRLADGLIKNGLLNYDAMARTADAVAFFYAKAKASGYDNVFVFATAAVRNAANGKDFCAILKNIDIDVDVLDGDTEAELGFTGASLNTSNANGSVIFDIGGASTEIMIGKNGKLEYKKSVQLGMVVLSDLCGTDKIKIEQTVKNYLKDFNDCPVSSYPLYGIGGTATSLAAMALNLEKYDVTKTHNCFISERRLLDMEEIICDKCALDPAKILKHFPSLSINRASIIGHGIIMTKHILRMFDKDGFYASETDNMEGYLILKQFK